MRRGFGIRILAGLVVLALVGTLAAIAYGAGYSAGHVNGVGVAPGWHLLGFLFGLFVLFVVFRLVMLAIFGHRHGPWGYGPWHYGYGPYGQSGPQGDQPAGPADPTQSAGFGPGPWRGGWRHYERFAARQAMLDDWHRHAHESGTGSGPSATSSPAAGGTNPTGGPSAGGSFAGGPGTRTTGV